MPLIENANLQPYNTFGIGVKARWLASFSGDEELAGLLEGRDGGEVGGSRSAGAGSGGAPLLVLGGGSNILFTGDFDGLVLKNEVRGIDLIREDEHYVYVRVGAGENWHSFVQYCLRRNWAGVENLSLIPGNVGASPMQNIGAYGVEMKDRFSELEAFNLADKIIHKF